MYNGESQLNTKNYRETVSFACIAFCGIILAIHGLLPIIPSNLTKFIKPIFIAICLVSLGRGGYKLGATKWMIVLLAYFSAILVSHDLTQTAINMYLSIMLFGVFFLFAANRMWSRKEILLILVAFVVACDIQAIIMLWSNSGLLHSSGNQHVSYLGYIVNRNPVAFAIAPGAICSLTILLYKKQRSVLSLERLFYMFSFALCFFVVFALGCRSAFWATVAGVVINFWGKMRNMNAAQRVVSMIGGVVLTIIIALIALNSAGDTYSSRLFDFSEEGFDSGRDEIWETAWEGIEEKPVFGGGFDYWDEVGGEMGTHNTFLLYMLFGGYIAGALLALLLLATAIQAIKTKQLLPLAFLMQTICHCYTETDFDYYACMPLIMAYIIIKYLNSHSCRIDKLFSSN